LSSASASSFAPSTAYTPEGHAIGFARESHENARRQTLDVAELLVLAQALDVPPLALLFPGQAATPIKVLPGVTMTTLSAVQWFGADRGLGPRVEMQATIAQLEALIG
jgi:hypothetical protein